VESSYFDKKRSELYVAPNQLANKTRTGGWYFRLLSSVLDNLMIADKLLQGRRVAATHPATDPGGRSGPSLARPSRVAQRVCPRGFHLHHRFCNINRTDGLCVLCRELNIYIIYFNLSYAFDIHFHFVDAAEREEQPEIESCVGQTGAEP
jgi:hypothetical protein